MTKIIAAILIAGSMACAKSETTTPVAGETTSTSAAVAAKTYPMNGVIVSRNAANNSINIDNEDVPGVMAPMKMDYELRGAKVDSLLPDGTKVQLTLHEQDGTYWVTDVKQRQ